MESREPQPRGSGGSLLLPSAGCNSHLTYYYLPETRTATAAVAITATRYVHYFFILSALSFMTLFKHSSNE